MNIFADRLNIALKTNHLNAKELVELSKPYWTEFDSKLTEADISLYLRKDYNPSRKKLSILAKTLGVSEAWLVGHDENSISSDEQLLLNAWRLAPDSVRVNVAFLLREYGMSYEEKKVHQEAIS